MLLRKPIISQQRAACRTSPDLGIWLYTQVCSSYRRQSSCKEGLSHLYCVGLLSSFLLSTKSADSEGVGRSTAWLEGEVSLVG